MSSRPRCARCNRRGPTQPTMAGALCKHCADSLPPHLTRDPTQPRPAADTSHRATKRAGVGAPRRGAPGRQGAPGPAARKRWRAGN